MNEKTIEYILSRLNDDLTSAKIGLLGYIESGLSDDTILRKSCEYKDIYDIIADFEQNVHPED